MRHIDFTYYGSSDKGKWNNGYLGLSDYKSQISGTLAKRQRKSPRIQRKILLLLTKWTKKSSVQVCLNVLGALHLGGLYL